VGIDDAFRSLSDLCDILTAQASPGAMVQVEETVK
jgi:hypothetical protein